MKKTFITLAVGLLGLTACGGDVFKKDEGEKEYGDGLKIVTTIPPLYSLTAHLIEGTNTKLTNILPPNASPHTYQLTFETARALAEADLVVMNGLELELFLERSLHDVKGLVVVASEGIELIKDHHYDDHDHHHDDHHYDDHDHHHDDHHYDDHDHHHGEYNPHVWLSPSNAIVMADNILIALMEGDAENEEIYRRNFEELRGKLKDLQEEIHAKISRLEVGHYLVFHDAYPYFERDFGIRAKAFIEEFPGKEPSARYLAGLVDMIVEKGVEVIFTEPQFSPKLVETLAKDYGLRVAELDPLGSEISKTVYFDMMRGNVAVFEAIFSIQNGT